jgi:glutathione S-transferase
MMPPIRLHRFRLSGHSHRVELFLSLLGLPFEMIEVELGKGMHKTPDYLALNRFGQVPVIEDRGLVLADSNAILVYIAATYDASRRWYPADPVGQAAVQRWLSAAAGPLLTGPGFARLVGIFDAKHDLARAQAVARGLFTVMEGHLAAGDGFFAAPHPTIADVALYTYTAHAPEGHLDLAPYPAIRRWLAAVEALPGFVPMARTAPRFGLAPDA